MSQKSVTLKTIAQELGLSVTAVSKALRGSGNISKETVRKVKETAQRLNYRPNSLAKSLRTNKTKTIGLIVSDSSFSFLSQIIEGIEKTASEYGYNIILCNAYSSVEKEMEAVKILVNKRVDGLLLAASMLVDDSHRAFLDSFGVPYVFLVRRGESNDCDYVINDSMFGSYQMVDYLIKTGSPKIHFINIYEKISSHSDRLTGYLNALEDNGIEFDKNLILGAKPSVEEGYCTMNRLLLSGEKVSAVFCGCDVIAVGAMEAILEAGLSIPGDIRVAGYDDIEFAAYLRVPLTTVSQPKNKIAKMGTELLIDKIQGKYTEYQNIILRSDIVLRKST